MSQCLLFWDRVHVEVLAGRNSTCLAGNAEVDRVLVQSGRRVDSSRQPRRTRCSRLYLHDRALALALDQEEVL